MSKSRYIVPVVLLALLAAGFFYLRGSVESRVDDLFANLRQAVEEGPVRDIIACCDEDYDFYAHWPVLRGYPVDVDDPDGRGHPVALRVLQGYFLRTLNRDTERSFTYEILEVAPAPDREDEFAVRARIGYTVSGGVRLGEVESQTIGFTLRQSGGLFPTMRILSHDRIEYYGAIP